MFCSKQGNSKEKAHLTAWPTYSNATASCHQQSSPTSRQIWYCPWLLLPRIKLLPHMHQHDTTAHKGWGQEVHLPIQIHNTHFFNLPSLAQTPGPFPLHDKCRCTRWFTIGSTLRANFTIGMRPAEESSASRATVTQPHMSLICWSQQGKFTALTTSNAQLDAVEDGLSSCARD